MPFEAAAQQKRAQIERESERERESVISTGKATLKRRQTHQGLLAAINRGCKQNEGETKRKAEREREKKQ